MNLVDRSSLFQKIHQELLESSILDPSDVMFVENEPYQVEDFKSISMIKYPDLFEVHSFARGDEAMDYASRGAVAAAVVDCLLENDASGVEVAARIKESNPSTPIIMATAYADRATSRYRQQAEELGLKAESWFSKPYNPERLVDATAEAVRKQKISEVAWLAVSATLDALQLEKIASDTGVVARIAQDCCSVNFDTSKGVLRRDFPTWRLRRAGADLLGAKVVHYLGAIADAVVSRLSLINLPEALEHVESPAEVSISEDDYNLLDEDRAE
ncbi:MAG: response regulator [Terriglobia bacterium]